MKLFLKRLGTIIGVIFVLLYLCASIHDASFNLLAWEAETRHAVSAFLAILSVISIVVCAISVQDIDLYDDWYY